MDDKLILVKRKICCANVISWIFTFIQACITIIFHIEEYLFFVFMYLFITQLLISIFVSVSTYFKKFFLYKIAIIFRVLNQLGSIVFFVSFVLIMSYFTVEVVLLLIGIAILIMESIPTIFTFIFLKYFKQLNNLAIQNNVNNISNTEILENH